MNILYFITPQTMVKVGAKATEFIPLVGPQVEFYKKTKKLTELSDPVSATSKGIGLIFKQCFGKTATLSAECIIWFGCSVVGGITGNLPIIALGAQVGNLIVDELLD